MINRYTNYSAYLRNIFGGDRIQKVAINAGFTCPNRDGTIARGGCTFCLNEAFTPSYCTKEKSVAEQIREGIYFHAHRYAHSTRFLAYFQSYSNTYKPLDELRAIYEAALAEPDIVGLVIGTRPDCVDREKLEYFRSIADRGKYVIIEYGVESIFDDTLRRVNRGHDYATACRAIELTASMGLHVGAHFIIGLPGEGRDRAIQTARAVASLPLTTVKFHQLQIFKGTALEKEYTENPSDFSFYALDEYIDLFVDMLELLPPELVIERFAGEAPPRFQAMDNGWGAIRNERLVQLLDLRLEERATRQGAKYHRATFC
ncbi:MAG: TIGR01212 family radical SAM protein [Mucinivorans sp.]